MDLVDEWKHYSMKPDMVFGWRPDNVQGAPIPFHYDSVNLEVCRNPATKQPYPVYFFGKRYVHSVSMHRAYANLPKASGPPTEQASYPMKFPPQENIVEAICQKSRFSQDLRPFTGQNPNLEKIDFLRQINLG